MTPDEIRARIRRNPSLAAVNPGFGSELQKLKEHPIADAKKGTPADERNHGRFCISVDLRLSNRLQDPDGALSTIMDCLRDARGRFTEIHSQYSHGSEHLPSGGRVDPCNNQPEHSLKEVKTILEKE
jgi:hypothetical protein